MIRSKRHTAFRQMWDQKAELEREAWRQRRMVVADAVEIGRASEAPASEKRASGLSAKPRKPAKG
jgi:hypothetical protein